MREIIRGKLIEEGLLPAPVEHQGLVRTSDGVGVDEGLLVDAAALLRTKPPSRILTRIASKKTSG